MLRGASFIAELTDETVMRGRWRCALLEERVKRSSGGTWERPEDVNTRTTDCFLEEGTTTMMDGGMRDKGQRAGYLSAIKGNNGMVGKGVWVFGLHRFSFCSFLCAWRSGGADTEGVSFYCLFYNQVYS